MAPKQTSGVHGKPAGSAANTTPRRRAKGRPRGSSETVGREALLDAACALLERERPDRVTRAAVARTLNVDPSLIRYYFRSRESLLVAAAHRVTEEFRHLLAERLSRIEDTPLNRLRARIAAQLDMHLRFPFFHRLVMEVVFHSDDPDAKALFKELTERGLSNYDQIVSLGVEQGSMRRVDPVFLYIAVVGMCEYSVAAEPILQFAMKDRYDRRAAFEAYAEFVTELVLDGLKSIS